MREKKIPIQFISILPLKLLIILIIVKRIFLSLLSSYSFSFLEFHFSLFLQNISLASAPSAILLKQRKIDLYGQYWNMFVRKINPNNGTIWKTNLPDSFGEKLTSSIQLAQLKQPSGVERSTLNNAWCEWIFKKCTSHSSCKTNARAAKRWYGWGYLHRFWNGWEWHAQQKEKLLLFREEIIC